MKIFQHVKKPFIGRQLSGKAVGKYRFGYFIFTKQTWSLKIYGILKWKCYFIVLAHQTIATNHVFVRIISQRATMKRCVIGTGESEAKRLGKTFCLKIHIFTVLCISTVTPTHFRQLSVEAFVARQCETYVRLWRYGKKKYSNQIGRNVSSTRHWIHWNA